MSLGVGDCIETKKKPWEHWGKELPSASCDSLPSLGPYTLSFCPRGGIIQSEEETQREWLCILLSLVCHPFLRSRPSLSPPDPAGQLLLVERPHLASLAWSDWPIRILNPRVRGHISLLPLDVQI